MQQPTVWLHGWQPAAECPLEIQPRHPVHPEAEGDLTTVMNVVLDEVPDDPLARALGPLSSRVGRWPYKLLSEISRRPALQPRLDHREALLEPPDDLVSGPRSERLILIPIGHQPELGRTLPHPRMHPSGPGRHDVTRERPHRPQMRGSSKIQLGRVQRRDHLYQPLLVVLIAATHLCADTVTSVFHRGIVEAQVDFPQRA